MQKKIFNVPILFIIFNRPDYAQVVFNEIKKIKPKKLYIAADGPRKCNENDLINCSKTREIINQVNWECDVKTSFRKENLGCKVSVSSAITWFFKNEPSGIILEDDCLPEQSFFWFCEELLEKYKNNKKVMMISGTSYLFNKAKFKESYFFTNFFAIWGWATWRRAWDLYDINMNGWEDYKKNQKLLKIYKDQSITDYIESMCQNAYDNLVNTWDIQWFFSCLKNESYSIMPKINLISNIGVSGTHSDYKTNSHFFPTKPINLKKIVHPQKIILDSCLNNIIYKNILKGYPVSKFKKILLLKNKLFKRIIRRFFRFFNLEIKRINICDTKSTKYTTADSIEGITASQIEAYFLALNKFLNNNDKVLDVGFGLVYGINVLSIKASKIWGIEVDTRAFNYCQNILVGKNPKLQKLLIYNGYNIDFPDGYFDIVTCINVIEHVEDYEKLITDMLRVCKRGVFISTSIRKPEYAAEDGAPENHWHHREWSFEEFKKILEKFGKIEWSFVNGPYGGPFTQSSVIKSDTLTLSPFIFKASSV